METSIENTSILSKKIIEISTKYRYNYYDLNTILEKKKYLFFFKRLFDIIASLILLILFSPIILSFALIVRLTIKESGIFKQTRVGKNGKYFTIYKLRSMRSTVVYNEESLKSADLLDKGILVKHKDDPRIFPLGKFLRKSSIDELPQLFNVLIGNMSIIGPRPLILKMSNIEPEIEKPRYLVKPGITGWWQVNARGIATNVFEMLEFDIHYLKNLSFKNEFIILFKTIYVVLLGKGAI